MIVVIDSGTGNLQSVQRALNRVGAEAKISVAVSDVEAADKIVLPGVGSAAAAISTLDRLGLVEPLRRRVLDEGIPLLGICVGMQLLTRSSEEGNAGGLGWIDSDTIRISSSSSAEPVKVPHLGWNTLDVLQRTPLFRDIPEGACFYFAHSYCVRASDRAAIAAETTYGIRFASAVQQRNVFGVQFHPEKSHANGLQVVRNFVQYT
jgi:glutamine amidotransferase